MKLDCLMNFSRCSVHPSSVLELLRTLLSFSKSNVYFRPGFFFSWAVKHEHMFVGKREREKKPRKSMFKCLALVKKCITLLLMEYFLTLIRFGSKLKCVLWSKMSKVAYFFGYYRGKFFIVDIVLAVALYIFAILIGNI